MYQHVLSRAAALAGEGEQVTLHTARDCELSPAITNVTYCLCMRWQRSGSKSVRQVLTLAWIVSRLCPHVFRVGLRQKQWEVQGTFASGAYVLCILVLRLAGVRPAFAPHNDFSRRGSRVDELLRRTAERMASAVIVYRAQAHQGRPQSIPLIRLPLTQYVPGDWHTRLPAWRQRWAGTPVVLFAGQLRPDKSPEVLLAASVRCSQPHRLAFVGQDLGAAAGIKAEAARLGLSVDVVLDYLPLADFAAALAAASVVVCPYRIASQSGVLSLAATLATPTIAADVGGLAEQADEVFAAGNVDDLAHKLDARLAQLSTREYRHP